MLGLANGGYGYEENEQESENFNKLMAEKGNCPAFHQLVDEKVDNLRMKAVNEAYRNNKPVPEFLLGEKYKSILQALKKRTIRKLKEEQSCNTET